MTGQLIVITGAAGFIGSSIVRLLRRSNVDVIAVTRGAVTRKRGGLLHVAIDDLQQRYVDSYRSIAFVHLAAETSAQRWEESEDLLRRDHERYLAQLVHCAQVAFQADNIRFVNASTATVIGAISGEVDDETNGAPETRYDAWKLEQEYLVYAAASEIGASSVSLRLPNIYGRLQDRPAVGRGFVTQQVERALRGYPLYYFDRVPFVRDYLHVDDAALAFILSAEPNISLNRSHVVGTGVGTSMVKLTGTIADSVHEILGRRPQILEVAAPSSLTKLDQRSVRIDSSKFRELTGWKPQIAIDQGIRTMVRIMYQHSKRSA